MKPLPALAPPPASGEVCTYKPKRSKRGKKGKRTKTKERQLARVAFRAVDDERQNWILAAAREGYLSLSDWMRDRLNAAARSRVLLSSDHQAYNTPAPILEALAPLGVIALDPCSNGTSIVGALTAWTIADDGLASSWAVEAGRRGYVYVNSPFDEVAKWIARAIVEAGAGAEIVVLCPNRPDVQWMLAALKSGATRADWTGRIRFEGAVDQAPFPVCLLYWGPRVDLFRRALAPHVTAFVVDHASDPRQLTIDARLARQRQELPA